MIPELFGTSFLQENGTVQGARFQKTTDTSPGYRTIQRKKTYLRVTSNFPKNQ